MRLVEAAVPTFARHETFHPRYGWFRKAYAAAARDSLVFARDDATVDLGVGKNMVRSIRFWGLAARLIVEDPDSPTPRSRGVVPTRTGHAIFGSSGWDPYMEDPATLWLLHWLLMSPQSRLPVWWITFNEFHVVEFTDDALEVAVTAQLEGAAEWKKPHISSVRKDISVFLRTYMRAEQTSRVGIDDVLDSPLRELQLVARSAATGQYRFGLGPKPTLPSAVIAYAVLDYIARSDTSGNTITMSRLAYEPGAPGRAFKLTESELVSALEPAIRTVSTIEIVAPTGAQQLLWRTEPDMAAIEILNDYYGSSAADDTRAGRIGDLPLSPSTRDALVATRDLVGIPPPTQEIEAEPIGAL